MNIVSTFGAMPTTVPNYAKLRNFISRSKSENANFKLPNMTIEFVLKHLRAMPAAKATGLDGISCKVLKLSAEIIAPHKGVDPDTKVGGTAYMSTQREVLEGQTGSHRAKRAIFGRGSGGPPPENVKNLHGKWCNLRYS